jgi:succinate dehydrogenase / fumarate reductase membrane anchor subunit
VSLRSPLGRAIGLGSAKSGTGHWFSQRVTAVAVLVLGPWFLLALLSLGSLRFDDLSRWLAQPAHAALSALLVIASAQHAWLGLEVVIEDYVGGRFARLLLLVASKAVFILAAAAGVLAVLRVATGAGA